MTSIDDVIKYGQSLTGITRGDENNLSPGNKGPFWASNGPLPSLKIIKEQGIVCVGLLALLARYAGVKLFFSGTKKPKGFQGDWGIGGTDEWMYHYKDVLEPIDVNGSYPRGTLLFRMFNTVDYGHVSVLMESCTAGGLLDTRVLQALGAPVGKNRVTSNEKVRAQHMYYRKHSKKESPQTAAWDKDKRFEVRFDGPYYTHILRPEHWLDTEAHRSARAMIGNEKNITTDAKNAIFALARNAPNESIRILNMVHKASARERRLKRRLETAKLEGQVAVVLCRKRYHPTHGP
jgi:hypothetical protein